MIQIKQLSLEHGSQKILKNIDLEILSGEFVFLIGQSGAGKSSLLDVIQGRKMYHEGSLKINDKELASFSFEELQAFRENLGIIFQDNRLIQEWTVYENLSYKMEYQGFPAPIIRSRIQEWTTLLGLETQLRSYPHQLSGGQQQRVNVIRALITQPKLVIADEPTANLDDKNAQKVFNLLKKVNQTGTTILMATHNPHFIETSNFRVLKFAKGEKVYDQVSSNYFR